MRKLCLFAIPFSLAVLCFVYGSGRAAWPAVAAGLAVLSTAAVLFSTKRIRGALIALSGVAVGFVWCFGYQALFLRPLQSIDAEPQGIEAAVADFPRQTNYGWSVSAKIRLEDREFLSVLYYDDETELLPGDRIICEAKLTRAEEKLKEDNFYYTSRGVWLIANANGALQTEKAKRIPIWALPACFAEKLRQQVKTIFPEGTSGLVTALLMGDKHGLSYAEKNELSIAGIYHAVAVSGMHVSILLGIILLLCGSNRRLAAVIGVPVVVLFVLMTGAPASAVRAGIMQIILLLAPLAGREYDMPTSLCTALFLLLAENPWSCQNVGLQMSFTSTAGLLLFAGKLYRYFVAGKWCVRGVGRKTAGAWFLRGMMTAFCCSFAASAFSLPIAAMQFETISLIAPLTNMLCLWAISLLFSGAMVVCVLSFLLGPLMLGPAWVLSLLVRCITAAVHLAARIPCAAVFMDNVYFVLFAVLYYGALVCGCIWPGSIWKRTSALALAGCFALCAVLAALDYQLPGFTFTALDVGQGQCLILNAGKETTMIDCGGVPDESGERAVRFLQQNGDFCVENLILTHYDADHVNGVCQLLGRHRVNTLYLPDIEDETGLKRTITDAAENAGWRVVPVKEDLFLQGKAEITVFAPVSGKNDNDACLSVLASAQKYDILVTGDMAEFAEYRLLSSHELPDLELLVAGHHGSKHSTTQALLDLTQPETVLISVGVQNRYGHPAAETLERIAKSGAVVFRTDECGTITVRG
ncbi:MAG: DNA internalization-related competence protein ComEC/Rec2 [Clostridia bacterium]|nr:DNA internalization-related competence protein ComEC/Rec2 [Clostridia bacterium]